VVLGAAGVVCAGAMGQAAVTALKPTTRQDNMFLMIASEGGLMEVQFGQLAVQRASSAEVRVFGQKMVDDQNLLNEKIKPVATAHILAAPEHLNRFDQAEFDKLGGLSGPDFDKEYLTVVMADQENELHQYRRAAAITSDAALKAAAQEGVKVLFEHKGKVEKLAAANGVAVPGHTSVLGPATEPAQ